jgi:hypothetical protein
MAKVARSAEESEHDVTMCPFLVTRIDALLRSDKSVNSSASAERYGLLDDDTT